MRMWLAAAVAAGARGDPTPMDAACKWVGEDGHAVSLAPFKGKEPELYRHVDNGYEYVVNLCGSVDASACASKTPDAVAIQDKIGGKSGCESVIGAVSPTAPPAWSQLGDTGYTISFAGGDAGCEDPPFVRVTAFQLLCDDNVALAELVHVIEDPKCVYTAQFKINCDVARNGGLAGKWSFASRVFFSTFLLVLMYVLVVMVLEKRKMGDDAEWQFPEHQKEFWREFMMCAREGLALTVDRAQDVWARWWESGGEGGGVSRSRAGYDPVATQEPPGHSGPSTYGSGGSGGGGRPLEEGGGDGDDGDDLDNL